MFDCFVSFILSEICVQSVIIQRRDDPQEMGKIGSKNIIPVVGKLYGKFLTGWNWNISSWKKEAYVVSKVMQDVYIYIYLQSGTLVRKSMKKSSLLSIRVLWKVQDTGNRKASWFWLKAYGRGENVLFDKNRWNKQSTACIKAVLFIEKSWLSWKGEVFLLLFNI